MGAACTKKSIDDVIPDQTNGGLAVHTTLSRASSRKIELDEGGAISPHMTRSESKKFVERQKVKAQLDAVQEQRARQQVAGVQRLHERTQSQKLMRSQSNAARAGKANSKNEEFKGQSFASDPPTPKQEASEFPLLFGVS